MEFDRFDLEEIKKKFEEEKEGMPELLSKLLQYSISLMEKGVKMEEEQELGETSFGPLPSSFPISILGPAKQETVFKIKVRGKWYPLKYDKNLNIWHLPLQKTIKTGYEGFPDSVIKANLIIFPDGKATTVETRNFMEKPKNEPIPGTIGEIKGSSKPLDK